jgi:hypothetical protein
MHLSDLEATNSSVLAQRIKREEWRERFLAIRACNCLTIR